MIWDECLEFAALIIPPLYNWWSSECKCLQSNTCLPPLHLNKSLGASPPSISSSSSSPSSSIHHYHPHQALTKSAGKAFRGNCRFANRSETAAELSTAERWPVSLRIVDRCLAGGGRQGPPEGETGVWKPKAAVAAARDQFQYSENWGAHQVGEKCTLGVTAEGTFCNGCLSNNSSLAEFPLTNISTNTNAVTNISTNKLTKTSSTRFGLNFKQVHRLALDFAIFIWIWPT